MTRCHNHLLMLRLHFQVKLRCRFRLLYFLHFFIFWWEDAASMAGRTRHSLAAVLTSNRIESYTSLPNNYAREILFLSNAWWDPTSQSHRRRLHARKPALLIITSTETNICKVSMVLHHVSFTVYECRANRFALPMSNPRGKKTHVLLNSLSASNLDHCWRFL